MKHAKHAQHVHHCTKNARELTMKYSRDDDNDDTDRDATEIKVSSAITFSVTLGCAACTV